LQQTSGVLVDTILLVAPDRGLKTLADVLTISGYAVHSVTNQSTALGSIRDAPPSVVIVNFQVYDLSVLNICLAFARTKPDLPLIAVGPKIDGREKAHVLAIGASDYVERPFDTGELVARIRGAIRRASR
jgi:DNA-binding response OmpR family regulator